MTNDHGYCISISLLYPKKHALKNGYAHCSRICNYCAAPFIFFRLLFEYVKTSFHNFEVMGTNN